MKGKHLPFSFQATVIENICFPELATIQRKHFPFCFALLLKKTSAFLIWLQLKKNICLSHMNYCEEKHLSFSSGLLLKEEMLFLIELLLKVNIAFLF